MGLPGGTLQFGLSPRPGAATVANTIGSRTVHPSSTCTISLTWRCATGVGREPVFSYFCGEVVFPFDRSSLTRWRQRLQAHKALMVERVRLVRLDFLLAEDLAHRALNQPGETFVPRRRAMLACVTCQKPRRPQLMRIAVLLGLVARQRHQPGFGLRRDDWFFARPWPILDRRQRPIAQRPLHAALNRLMVNPNSLPHRTERRILRDRPAASAPAIPGSPARFATAKESSIFQSLRRSLPIRPLAAILP